MGKSLLELLDSHQFTKGLDPKSEKTGMIKPDPGSAFDVNIKQSKAWLKATPKLYGTDIVRIMSQGQVDTKAIKKAAIKGAANIASKIPIVGGIVGGAISQLINPKLPDDLIVDDKIINTLYTDLLYGKIRNDKGTLGNFLKSNEGLKNLGENLKNAAISAAISGVTSVAAAGLDALINKKKFTLKKKKLPAVKLPAGKLYPDNFPSTFAFQSGIKDNIAVNQSQFSKRGGFIGGVFQAGQELGKAGDKIDVIKLSNNPTENGLTKGTSNRLDDFYITTYKGLENKLTGLNKSINLWDAKDTKSGTPNTYETINGIDYSPIVGSGMDTFNMSIVSQNYGTGDNLIKNTWETKDTTIKYGDNVIARQRFTNEKTFVDTDAKGSGLELYKKIATGNPYYKGQEKYVPYTQTKQDVLANNKYDIISLAINGIRLLGTITGLADNTTPSYTDVKPVGSGFKFYLYDSWEREISFKFQMYADNKEQLDLIWKKAENIKKLTLPTPKGQLGVFGKLISLKIGNIINSSYGFLTTCNLTVSDDSPWEITTGSQKPFLFEMDITYKVVSKADDTSYTFYS
jgi:hypothetical protein